MQETGGSTEAGGRRQELEQEPEPEPEPYYWTSPEAVFLPPQHTCTNLLLQLRPRPLFIPFVQSCTVQMLAAKNDAARAKRR
jgi:hypothetical protein